jgi:hypothetical protein
MDDGYLIIIFTVLFFYMFVRIMFTDIFIGAALLFLYIYTIFTQIGYVYLPELSVYLNAYFGPDVFSSYVIFVGLSCIAFYIMFCLFYNNCIRDNRYSVILSESQVKRFIFFCVIIVHLIYSLLFFVNNYELITYENASNEAFFKSSGISYWVFFMGFKLSVIINLVLYVTVRLKLIDKEVNRPFILGLLTCELLLFIVISQKIGSRTDLLALTLSILIFEVRYKLVMNVALKAKHIIFAVLILLSLALLANRIQLTRTENSFHEDAFLSERILFQDYYAPSHLLIAAIEYNYVDPAEVIVSNLSNTFVLLNYPYLQYFVTELFNPGVTTRSASYAFYLFTEGYIAMGWAGFIYNGIVVFAGFSLWRALASSDNINFNLFIYALISTQLANIARSQSSYFLKDIYVFFIPAMILFYLATGLRPSLRKIVT